MNTTQQNATKFGIAASRQWWRDARELAISFGPTLEDAIVAYIKLNFRDEVAQTAPSIEFYYSLLSKAFLTMYDAEIVNPDLSGDRLGTRVHRSDPPRDWYRRSIFAGTGTVSYARAEARTTG